MQNIYYNNIAMNELKVPSLQSLLDSDFGSSASLAGEFLQFDSAEKLNDAEFFIPPTNELPSLQSVLSEIQSSDNVSDFCTPLPLLSSSIDVSLEVLNDQIQEFGSLIKYYVMEGISSQISSAADRVNAGLPTACAISIYIAVGTSHGHLLHFDKNQTLRWAHQDKESQGAVAAVDFNINSTRLLAGYARGLIIMFDSNSGDSLRKLNDSITPNSGILNVKWTSSTALAVCADSGGSVWSLSFTRKVGIRSSSSRCLFSGARGEVCAVEPLILNSHHELHQYCIVALATLSKYFVVMIRPRLKVIKYQTLQGPIECLPLLAWQMALIQASDSTRSVDPVILVGRGNQIFFHQLFVVNGRITLLHLRCVQLNMNILSAHWLGPKCVGCIDTSEILHLIDVRSNVELERFDMENAHLVYGSALYKGLATGGNVSPALALVGTYACGNSIKSHGTKLYILGARSLNIIEIRTWTERIAYLVKNQRWKEACDLALNGFRLTATNTRRRKQAKDRILMLFKEYLAASTRVPENCLGAIIECLVTVEELDMLWTHLWNRLPNTSIFLENISQYIQNGHIQTVSPTVSQALVNHWLQHDPKKLDDIILKLNWICLDLNQVLKAAKSHKLYRAQIYLNSNALKDYTTSLKELIPLVESEHSDLGNNILVFISSCLAGRGYPSGDIPTNLSSKVKQEVMKCLTSRHTTSDNSNELPYPFLRTLLKFNAREMLNVISLAFQENEYNSELGLSLRKDVINILIEIMTPENNTWSNIGCLLKFVAQQIVQQRMPCDVEIINKTITYLSKEEIPNENVQQHNERESAWYELLRSNCLGAIITYEEQLELAQRAKCYYVEKFLLEKLNRYDNLMQCYFKNQEQRSKVFEYIILYIHQPERKIYDQLCLNFKTLLEVNATKTTDIVATYYKDNIQDFIDIIKDEEDLLYIFLRIMHDKQMNEPYEQCEKLLELICKRENGKEDSIEVENFLRTSDSYRIAKAIQIVNQYKLTAAAVFLYEKDNNFERAFELSMEILALSQGINAESKALHLSNLCCRISKLLDPKEFEKYWFKMFGSILHRDDFKIINKTLLHEASQYVDLRNLVQFVMSTQKIRGNFGDIKDILLSMLISSRSETKVLQTSAKRLGFDLHLKLMQSRNQAFSGVWIPQLNCALCHNSLCNQRINKSNGNLNQNNGFSVLLFNTCEHAIHESCVQQQIRITKANCTSPNLQIMAPNAARSNYSDKLFGCENCKTNIDFDLLMNIRELSAPTPLPFMENFNKLGLQRFNMKLVLKSSPIKF